MNTEKEEVLLVGSIIEQSGRFYRVLDNVKVQELTSRQFREHRRQIIAEMVADFLLQREECR